MATIPSTERHGIAFTGVRTASSPVHVVHLTDIGLDRDAFVRDVRPSFDRTEWDMYDVSTRRAQIEHDTSRSDAERRTASEAVRPHRRRAMRKYALDHRGGSRWGINFSDDRAFTQAVADYRARTREFALIEPDVSAHDGVLALLSSAAETVRAYRPNVGHIDAVLHQVSVFARPSEAGSPAPEGVHQDGADYIVSALVVERAGVSGGVSRIREGRDGTPFLEIELAPGEGIFQADGGTSLWHEISPIALADGVASGHRMTFGLDIHVS